MNRHVPYSHCMDLKSQIEYSLFRLGLAGLKPLPYPWSRGLLRQAGRVAGTVLGVRRKVAEQQLQTAFPELSAVELAELVGRVYDHLGATAAEVLCADPDVLMNTVTVEPGWAGLDRVMARGRGVIAATGHIGNFELGGRVLAQRFPLLDVVKTQRNAPFDRFLQEQRLRFGIRTVPVERSGRAVLAHLRSGGLVTLLMDQDAGKTGFATDFLGSRASTWPGAAKISIRTGCPVVPLAILRNDDGNHTLHIADPLEPEGLTDREEDIRDFTGRISEAVERFIRKRPEQWFWVHRRWKGAMEARRINESLTKS
ncbi:MAG: lysophospholipid acyltransferase family protein [Candidatus Krumholzibacteriota bacterium]